MGNNDDTFEAALAVFFFDFSPFCIADPPVRSLKGSQTIRTPSLVAVTTLLESERNCEQVNSPAKLENSFCDTRQTQQSRQLLPSQFQKMTELDPVDTIEKLFNRSKQTEC